MTKTIDLKMVDLLGRGKIHPALHVDEHGLIVGRVTEAGEYRLVASDRRVYSPDDVKDVLAFQPRPYADLAGRWPEDDALAFLGGEDAPTFSEVLALTVNVLDDAMEFPRREQRALVAVWSVATYFHQFFFTFPRLNLSGERETGKSKLLTLLRAIAWNALLMLNPTPAVLFRLVHEFRPTLLLDEVEGLNKEDAREVLAIINSGYKVGASVPRCEGERTKRVELFDVYSPLALAAINSVNATTEDRCVPLRLQRGTNYQRINTEVNPAGLLFSRIRSGCYRLLLTRWKDVREAYQAIEYPLWLNGRVRELWRPLLAIARVADRENGIALAADLLVLAREHAEDRDPISVESEALLAVLADRIGPLDQIVVHPGELTHDLQERLGWREPPTPELVGSWLRRFFSRSGRDRQGAKYPITTEMLRQLTVRYTPQTTVTPSPPHVK